MCTLPLTKAKIYSLNFRNLSSKKLTFAETSILDCHQPNRTGSDSVKIH